MSLQPWQTRLLEETMQAEIRLAKQLAFLKEVEDPQVPTSITPDQLGMLEIHAQVLGAYLRLLRERCRRDGVPYPPT